MRAINAEPRRREGARLELQPVAQVLLNDCHFCRGQLAELAFQFDSGNGVDLLKMKRAFFEKRLGDGEFPWVTMQTSRMREHGDQRKFIIGP